MKTLIDILKSVSAFSGIPIKTLKGKSRARGIVYNRHIFCKIAKDEGYILDAIGRSINRDHSTVLHSLRNVYEVKEVNDLLTKYYRYEIGYTEDFLCVGIKTIAGHILVDIKKNKKKFEKIDFFKGLFIKENLFDVEKLELLNFPNKIGSVYNFKMSYNIQNKKIIIEI